MRRRRFLRTAVGTEAAAMPLTSASARPSRVGTSDVIRLRNDIERLVALDAERGGHGLEQAALPQTRRSTRRAPFRGPDDNELPWRQLSRFSSSVTEN